MNRFFKKLTAALTAISLFASINVEAAGDNYEPKISNEKISEYLKSGQIFSLLSAIQGDFYNYKNDENGGRLIYLLKQMHYVWENTNENDHNGMLKNFYAEANDGSVFLSSSFFTIFGLKDSDFNEIEKGLQKINEGDYKGMKKIVSKDEAFISTFEQKFNKVNELTKKKDPSPTTQITSKDVSQDLHNKTTSDKEADIAKLSDELKSFADGKFSFTADKFQNELNKVTNKLEEEPALLDVTGYSFVVGDIHGNMYSLINTYKEFFKQLKIVPECSIIFLGDYVDRGQWNPYGCRSAEVLYFIWRLKNILPNQVFLLRGNHEDAILNQNYEDQSCYASLEQSFGKPNAEILFRNVAKNFYSKLSIAAILNNHNFCVHAGFSPCLFENGQTVREFFNRSKRDLYTEEEWECGFVNLKNPLINFLWSDPYCEEDKDDLEGFQKSSRQCDQFCTYTPHILNEFLETNGLKNILRGHEVNLFYGVEDVFISQKVYTIFSSTHYCNITKDDTSLWNPAAILFMEEDGDVYDIDEDGVVNDSNEYIIDLY